MKACEFFRNIKFLLMDVDGVLNDGRLYYIPNENGNVMIGKTFNVKDGLGLNLWKYAGYKFGIITGRKDEVVKNRCKELGCHFLRMGLKKKVRALEEALKEFNLSPEEVAYIGDDWNDVPVFKRVGAPVTVYDAPEEIKTYCVYVTSKKGGRGAVRELIEEILKCQELFNLAVERFLKDHSS
jgi:3-deoxy-D-manno-octulosonate 8-phosphate phosphatase (KDO 8-P phosphatase)